MLRQSRPVQLGVGAVMLAIPASAVALTATQADAQSAIEINPTPRHIGFGRDVTVTGSTAPSSAGQRLQLEFVPAGATRWQPVSSTRVQSDGRFRFVAPLRRSGSVRVVGGGDDAGRALATTRAGGTAASSTSPSASRRVSVAAGFRVRSRSIDTLGGQPVHVRGELVPAVAGRRVRLITRSGGSWHTVATARTGARGGFDLHYAARGTGRRWLRVGFAGDRLNARSWAYAGRLTTFRQSVASWYTDGGATACGFHAHFGVANRDLPCGTKVMFRDGGHTVTAVVDDRGPFVSGREWDLNQNTAGALGFGGVGTVWLSS
jgi:rare lipoprotein A